MSDQEPSIAKQDDQPKFLPPEGGESPLVKKLQDKGGKEAREILEIKIERPTPDSINKKKLKEIITEFAIDSNQAEDTEYNYKKALRLIGENRFYTATHHGEIIGIIALLQQGKHPDFEGRDIFEVTQFYTKSKYRKKQVNKRLKDQLKADLQAEHPDYLLLVITEVDIVAESLLRKGYRDLEDPERLYEIIMTRPNLEPTRKDLIRSWVDSKISDPKTRILIFDPK